MFVFISHRQPQCLCYVSSFVFILSFIVTRPIAGFRRDPCDQEGVISWIKDQFGEQCSKKWILNDFSGLQEELNTKLYGQHLATRVVATTIRGHLEQYNPPKALSLSLHGSTGIGKTFVSEMIARHLYKNGMNSKFVKRFYSQTDFPDARYTDQYRKKIQEKVSACVSICCQCLFIFDDVDKMPPGVFDAIKPYLDHYVDDYRRSIFIFISNIGTLRISIITLEHWKSGKKREELQLKSIEPVLRKAVYNIEGGLKRSALIEHNLLGTFIPFLPLERQHIKQCILSAVAQKYSEYEIDRVANEFSYYPDSLELYAKMGCTGITDKAYLICTEDKLN